MKEYVFCVQEINYGVIRIVSDHEPDEDDVIEQYESGNFAVRDTEIAKIVLSEVSDVED